LFSLSVCVCVCLSVSWVCVFACALCLQCRSVVWRICSYLEHASVASRVSSCVSESKFWSVRTWGNMGGRGQPLFNIFRRSWLAWAISWILFQVFVIYLKSKSRISKFCNFCKSLSDIKSRITKLEIGVSGLYAPKL